MPLATEKSAPSSRGRWPRGSPGCCRRRPGCRRRGRPPRAGVRRTRRARGWTGSRSTAAGRRRGRRAARPRRSGRCGRGSRTPGAAPGPGEGLVAVVGQDDGVAGAGLGEQDGGDGGHAGSEDDGVHAVLTGGLQFADGPFQQGPGGVGVAAVGVRAAHLAGEVEVRGEDGSGEGGFVLDGLGQPGAHGAGGVRVPVGDGVGAGGAVRAGGSGVHGVVSFTAARTASSRPGLAASTSSRHSSKPSREP